MRPTNEVAAGEFASHQGQRLREACEKLEANGYKLDRRSDFYDNAGSDALVLRARKFTGAWVLWDTNDDDDGFLLVGDDWEALYREFLTERGDWLEGGPKAAVSC